MQRSTFKPLSEHGNRVIMKKKQIDLFLTDKEFELVKYCINTTLERLEIKVIMSNDIDTKKNTMAIMRELNKILRKL